MNIQIEKLYTSITPIPDPHGDMLRIVVLMGGKAFPCVGSIEYIKMHAGVHSHVSKAWVFEGNSYYHLLVKLKWYTYLTLGVLHWQVRRALKKSAEHRKAGEIVERLWVL